MGAMSQQTDLSALFRRDLVRLAQELEAYPEDLLWKTCPGIANSAGNLALHLEGNLRHFVGLLLGGVAFTRQRDLEFSTTGTSRAELVSRIQPLQDLVANAVANLSSETLAGPNPSNMPALGQTANQFLIALYGHLSYHMGQIDYLRRTLSGNGAVEFAGL